MESEEVFVFQGPGETVCFSTKLADMRESGNMCDVTIHAENLSFRAHRIVLTAAIPYFEAMFRSDMTESSKEDIPVKGIDASALILLLNFVYTNKLPITNLNVIGLLEASRYLQFDIGMDACFRFYCERTSVDNVMTLRFYASTFPNKDDVVHIADRFIRQNFENVSKKDDFNGISFDVLNSLICRDDLYVVSEEVVFESVLRWVRESRAERSVHLPNLLGHVRMNLLPWNYFRERVCAEELILASPACESIINEAKESHNLLKKSSLFSICMAQERVCKEKRHLKCARIEGSALYVVCEAARNGALVYFYDIRSEEFVLLHEIEDLVLTDVSHVVCTEKDIYFLQREGFQEMNLENFQVIQRDHSEIELDGSGIVLYHETVYLFGGFGAFDTVRTFDLHRGECGKAATMAEKRVFPGVTSLGVYIYIIGGNRDLSIPCSAERFNPLTGESVSINGMLTRKLRPNCCALNGKIYVHGEGVHPCSQTKLTFETYDPLRDEWNEICSTKQSSIPYTCFVCSSSRDNKIYFIYDRPHSFFNMCTYGPEDDVWRNKASERHSSTDDMILTVVSTNSAASLKERSDNIEPDNDYRSVTAADWYEFTPSESEETSDSSDENDSHEGFVIRIRL